MKDCVVPKCGFFFLNSRYSCYLRRADDFDETASQTRPFHYLFRLITPVRLASQHPPTWRGVALMVGMTFNHYCRCHHHLHHKTIPIRNVSSSRRHTSPTSCRERYYLSPCNSKCTASSQRLNNEKHNIDPRHIWTYVFPHVK